MEDFQYMQELDMPANMRAISKLPFRMREQCKTKAHHIMEIINQRANFIDLFTFIEHWVSILSDALLGDIQDLGHGFAWMKTLTRFKSSVYDSQDECELKYHRNKSESSLPVWTYNTSTLINCCWAGGLSMDNWKWTPHIYLCNGINNILQSRMAFDSFIVKHRYNITNKM